MPNVFLQTHTHRCIYRVNVFIPFHGVRVFKKDVWFQLCGQFNFLILLVCLFILLFFLSRTKIFRQCNLCCKTMPEITANRKTDIFPNFCNAFNVKGNMRKKASYCFESPFLCKITKK